jgi:hypothetical protein
MEYETRDVKFYGGPLHGKTLKMIPIPVFKTSIMGSFLKLKIMPEYEFPQFEPVSLAIYDRVEEPGHCIVNPKWKKNKMEPKWCYIFKGEISC